VVVGNERAQLSMFVEKAERETKTLNQTRNLTASLSSTGGQVDSNVMLAQKGAFLLLPAVYLHD
jgi:hypothetical protein